MKNLESYFEKFRKNIIGVDAKFSTPYGTQKMIYADWIASGRLYGPIEDKIKNKMGPMVGNTHSEASETGVTMTHLYHQAQKRIKQHVNANKNDIIITEGSGMTGVAVKLQRILGLKIPEQSQIFCKEEIPDKDRPVVFITHMEHHSNHTSWLETMADVVVLEPDKNLLVDSELLKKELTKYKDRNLKIGSFSAGSNVTGIIPPYYQLAEIMHEQGGYIFVDFAASAPYIDIDMHPSNPKQHLDAVMFSPHKALGGPGSSGVVIFNKILYKNEIPDHPGGGTVSWTNRWNEYEYIKDIEAREDG
ncbi:MAG: aminotransferase class V-fold PLP-dependent enzyme, partial [Bacteroidota bacterium]|nr:aminotransferase class V-fold PLP-dependent enzyme [Bacteroidota bacterium]